MLMELSLGTYGITVKEHVCIVGSKVPRGGTWTGTAVYGRKRAKKMVAIQADKVVGSMEDTCLEREGVEQRHVCRSMQRHASVERPQAATLLIGIQEMRLSPDMRQGPLVDFVFLLPALDSRSKLHFPLARSSVGIPAERTTYGNVGDGLYSHVGNVLFTTTMLDYQLYGDAPMKA